ncbi:MAG: hypothetical protein Q4D35_05340 [Ruminococcus sp.]|nr:hypothetical protein [Ruminococcus sp.]
MVPPGFMHKMQLKVSYNGDRPMRIRHTHKVVSEFMDGAMLSADGNALCKNRSKIQLP